MHSTKKIFFIVPEKVLVVDSLSNFLIISSDLLCISALASVLIATSCSAALSLVFCIKKSPPLNY